ncbi:MAG TPA: PQQ-binding-like beta-propeller repeat protein [Humisphaera sp.]
MNRLLALTLVLLAATAAPAAVPPEPQDWPQWRGAKLDGRSPEVAVPTTWSGTENVAWKTKIPGKGHSSPVVCNGRVFVTTALEDSGDRALLCLDRKDGKVLWQKAVLSSPLEKKHKLNSFASSTPATDGKLVFVSFFQNPKMVVAAYDFDGNEVWRTSPGTFSSVHGYCSSPVVYKNLLILNGDQDAPAFLVALDKGTGKEVWRTDRPNKTRSYCVPLITELAGKTQMVLAGSKCIASYDPDTGKQIWIIDGPTEQMVASLVTTNGILFYTGGFPDLHVMGIDPSGTGNVTKTHELWRDGQNKGDRKIASYVPSPIAFGDWFYVVSDGGQLSCYDAKTGQVKYRQKLGRHHSASAVADGNGHLYFTSDAGETFVVQAGPEYKQVAKNELGEEVYASPAISKGQIFIRGSEHLFCIGK